MIDAALAYVGAGWPVFTLGRGRKTPAGGRGFHDATLDPEQVHQWWTDHPRANIGVAAGAAGLVVIDVDAHDDGPDGWANWCALVAAHADAWPDTFEVTTPSGGQHIYFAAPAGEPVRNSASKLAPGVDVRASGGYVVAAPSATDAGRYTVDRGHPVAPLPAWLERLLRPPRPVPLRPTQARTAPLVRPRDRYAAAALEAEVAEVVGAPVGTRNDRLNTAAYNLGQLVGAGKIDAGTVVAALLTAAVSAGLSEREASQTVESGLVAGVREPRVAA